MPLLLVRNETPGPSVFSDLPNNIAIEWQGKGDASGEDIQQVPASLLDNVNFVKAMRRGVYTVVEADEETQAILDKQVNSYQQRQAATAAANLEAMDPQANNDLIVVPCIGPADRGQGICGADVPVKEKERHDRPPLCSRHAALSTQFVLVEGEVNNETGKPSRTWSFAGVSAVPLPSQQ